MSPARSSQHRRRKQSSSGLGGFLVAVALLIAVAGAATVWIMRKDKSAPSAAEQAAPQRDEPVVLRSDDDVAPPDAMADDVIPPDPPAASKVAEPERTDEPLGIPEPSNQPRIVTGIAPRGSRSSRPPRRAAAAGRSPLMQPGEMLDKPIPAPRFGDEPTRIGSPMAASSEQPPPPKPGEVIDWTEAKDHVGRTVTVTGRIVGTNDTGEVCFLNFAKDWRGKFYLIVFKSAMGSWPQRAEDYFLDQTVEATGEVKLHNGTPQLQVRRAEQLKRVSSASE